MGSNGANGATPGGAPAGDDPQRGALRDALPAEVERLRERCRQAELLADSIHTARALLDSDGRIVAVSQAWSAVDVPNGLAGARFAPGDTYADLCDTVADPALRRIGVGDRVRGVLSGETATSALHYMCEHEAVVRRFHVSIRRAAETGADAHGAPGLIVRHVELPEAMGAYEQLEHLFDLSLDMLSVVGFDGLFRRVSHAFIEQLGYHEDELLHTPLVDLLHPDDRDRTLAAIADLERGRTEIEFENRIRRKDGDYRWLEWRATADSPSGLLYGVARDVTDRRRAQEDRRRLLDVLTRTPDFVGLASPAGRPLWVNDSGRKMVGLAPEVDITTLSMLDFHPPWAAEIVEQVGIPTAARSGSWAGEVALVRPDGGETPISIVIVAHRNETGEVEFVSGVMRDLSPQKQLEAQLRHSQKLESVGRLAGGVAHDFNNLLTVILGATEMAERTLASGGDVGGNLAAIRRSGEQAASLTSQLLAFARRQIVEPRVVDLGELVAEVHRLLERVLGEDITCVVTAGARRTPVEIDPGQIEQILVNLAVNARDAMPDGGRLTIATRPLSLAPDAPPPHADMEPGEYVELSVQDTGVGMKTEVRAQAFEPFFTTKPRGKGTGLGLSTCHGIVKQSDGHILLESDPGKGTTVRIFLPRCDDREPKPVTGPLSLESEGSETILVVEDEELVRELAVEALRLHGYRVLDAADGDEALRVATEHPDRIDVLLTDVVLPGMSGKQVADRLVALRPEIRVLFTSGYTEDTIVHHGVLQDGVQFLPKPYTPSSVGPAIRRLLDA